MPSVYQLRIVLREVSPLIWRRLLVRDDTSLAALHAIIQTAMSWSDTHLHQFRIHGKAYGIAPLGAISFADDPFEVQLCDLQLHRGERFFYEYDFTDGWVLEIRLEEILPLEPKGVLVLQARNHQTYGEGIRKMNALRVTVDEVRASPAFTLMEKQRVHNVAKDIFAQLEQVGF